MFSKIWTSAALVLALTLQVTAHAAVSPALGVSGTPVRNDVKRPSANSPCGAGVNIANTIDTSTAVAASAAGSFNADAISFNGGGDGSRKVTAKVDATGKGTKFVAMSVTTNGDPAPKSAGSQPIVAALPAGTKALVEKPATSVSFNSSLRQGLGIVWLYRKEPRLEVPRKLLDRVPHALRSLSSKLVARGWQRSLSGVLQAGSGHDGHRIHDQDWSDIGWGLVWVIERVNRSVVVQKIRIPIALGGVRLCIRFAPHRLRGLIRGVVGYF